MVSTTVGDETLIDGPYSAIKLSPCKPVYRMDQHWSFHGNEAGLTEVNLQKP